MRGALVAVLALVLGCGAEQRAPADVAQAYFRALGSDPIRTLPLLTPAFHRRHGLHVATAAEAQAGSAAVEAESALALDRHQLGWLAILSRPALAEKVSRLVTQIGDTREAGDRASVAVRVDPHDGPGFEQRFALVRASEEAPWRIDAIEQQGVAPASLPAAFAAYPNEAARRALAGARP